jgi:hypothetical protein
VEKANDFFVSVASDIQPLDVTKLEVNERDMDVPVEFFISVLDMEVLFNKTKIYKAIGSDHIPNWIWIDCSHVIAPPLISLVCQSIRVKVWPQTTVVHLAKEVQPKFLESDLRPVGLTCCVSKQVAENMMVSYIWKSIQDKIDKYKVGVVKGGSTVCAMIYLINQLLLGAKDEKSVGF